MKKKNSFKNLVVSEIKQKKSGESNYGYLRLSRDINMFKEEPGGKVRLNILPYLVTDKHHADRDEELGRAVAGSYWYKRPFRIHRNVGEENNLIVCPSTFKKPCPVCEYKANLLKEGKRYNDDEVKALNFSIRNLYAIVPIGHPEYDEKPHVWDISQFLFQNKLADEILENEDYGGFFDPEDGYTLRIRFSEETIGKNKFAGISRIDFDAMDRKYDDKILKQVPELDKLLIVKSYSEIKEMFYGIEEEGDIEENIEENIEEEDVDIEEEDVEEEEEVVVKPVLTAVKKKNKRSVKERCPHGHIFGVDTDEFDECDECDIWDDCIDAKELNE